MKKTWEQIREQVLAKAPSAAPFLDILEKHWGEGKLTEAIAGEFIALFSAGRLTEAEALIISQMDADELILAQSVANKELRAMIDREKTIYNFFDDVRGGLLKVALGCCLAMVGL